MLKWVGYAESGYEIITDILEVTLKVIEGCTCSDGCPGCIQSQKTPIDKQRKPDVPESIGVALDRVRSQLVRSSLKQKEPITRDSSQKYKNSVSPEERKILDRIKQIEEMQRQNESKKKEAYKV